MTITSPYTPELLSPNRHSDRIAIQTYRKRRTTIVVDTMREQLEEIYAIRHPQSILTGFTSSQISAFISEITQERKGLDSFGVWAWYPWIMTLIHFLPEAMHTELRTSRNRNLITQKEQEQFYNAHVGVAGLSVGNSVVASLVHTGGAKYLRIADKDIVSGSNTNRIRVGFHMMGVPKYAVMAREVNLVNPYSKISVYKTGLTKQNIERFLTYPKPLDLVIDEMDNLYLKIQLRVLARKLRIPVIMAADNGDGVVVDIERYDLHPSLPLMHGQVPESELLAISPSTPRLEAARIISRWVTPQNIADRMKDSLLELGKSLYTWPQLGNAAFMAGSVLSYVARRILTDAPVREGKIVLSPDDLFIPDFSSSAMRAERQRKTDMFKKAIGLS